MTTQDEYLLYLLKQELYGKTGLYCDVGRNEMKFFIRVDMELYLTAEECEKYGVKPG